jgi:hypothetical protein
MRRSANLVRVLGAVLLFASCGKSPTGPDSVENSLVFTRANQSRISFPSGALLFVWCGPWDDLVATPSLQVLFAAPNVFGSPGPSWHLQAVVSDVTVGNPVTFPNLFISEQPKKVDIFVLDPPNELSTNTSESSGSITFQKLTCGSGGEVQFSINATIGSEFGDGPPITMAGTFRGPIGQPPPK